MPVQLTLQPRADHLRFEVTGTRTEGEFGVEMLKVWQQVAEECRARGLARVLGISKVSGHVPVVELFEVGERAPPMLARAGCKKVAYVVLGDRDAMRALKFGEDVAVNRGLTTKVFPDESSALVWLMQP